jgi:peptide/nickel transport system substrate-binding protein
MAADVIRDQLKRIGVDVQIISSDRATHLDTVFMRWDFDMVLQLLATGPDPTIGVTRFLHTNQIKKAAYVNAMGYSNPEVDKFLDLEFKQLDFKQRSATWYKIQDIVMSELPVLPIFEQPIVNTYRSNWVDMITGPYGVYQTREHAYTK